MSLRAPVLFDISAISPRISYPLLIRYTVPRNPTLEYQRKLADGPSQTNFTGDDLGPGKHK